MKRVISILLIASIIAAAGSFYLFREETARTPSEVTVDGKTFKLTYIATTQEERAAGLMNKTITDNTTMLFIFPRPGTYSFWMYHTNSSLDIVWLNVRGDAGTVVYLVMNAPPCYNKDSCIIYYPTAQANYVLEAKAGFADSNDVTIGSVVVIR